MKILVMFERPGNTGGDKMIYDKVKAAFPHAEIVTGHWVADGLDVTNAIRQIEVNGPEPEEIPAAFTENKDAEILIGSFCPFSSKGLAVFDNLKLLGVIRAGMENVNVEAAKKMGIAVVTAIGRNADSVSDFAMAMMLAECRNIARSHGAMIKGEFRRRYSNSASMPDMRGKNVGLVGFGYIGKLMAEKLSGFHINLLVYDPFLKQSDVDPFGGKLVDKETLFKESDFISIHARYTKETHHIVGKNEIALMKPTAYLINTARSGLMDYDALTKALQENRIAGAALDVFDKEPLDQDDPLLTLDNVTLTAHIAGGTVDAANNSPRLIVERSTAVLHGEKPSGMLNPEILDESEFKAWCEKAAKAIL